MKDYSLMVIATILWAGAFIAGKLGINNFSPLMITYLRMLLAVVIIFPVLIIKQKRDWQLPKEHVLTVFLLALIGMCGYHLLFFRALHYTTASNASVINAFNPLITALLANFMLHERIPFKKIVLIITAFVGVFLTITRWDIRLFIESGLNKGDMLMLLAATCWAVYSIIVKRGMKNLSPLKLTSYTFLMCVLLLTPFALKEIIYDKALSSAPFEAYLAILYMAIFPTIIGYTIQQHCIKTIGPSRTALFINLVPIFSIIFARVFLNESFYWLNSISVLVTLVSVGLFLKKPRRKQTIFLDH